MSERAGIWLAVSSSGQDERDQEPDIRRWCAEHGYEIAATYRLHAVSRYKGVAKHDEAIDQVVADMRAGVITVLVVWQSSRIERRGAYNAFDLARRVREAGGRIEYVKDAHLNLANQMSDVMLALNATMDQLSSKAKSDAILKKHAALREAKSLIGRPPFGFKISSDESSDDPGVRKVLVPDPELAPVITETVRRFLAGDSLMECAHFLDAKGVKPVSADTWGRTSLAKLLRNPSLAGRRKDASGRTVQKHEGIIDMATWNAVQDELKRKGRRRGVGNMETALLQQIAVCTCGLPMTRIICSAKRKNGDRYTRLYYRCRGTDKKPSKCGNLVLVDELDAWMDEQARNYPGRIVELAEIPGGSYQDEIDGVRRDIAELDPEADTYDADLGKLRAELKRFRALPPKEARTTGIVTSYTVADLWEVLTPADRRRYLLAAGVQVVAGKTKAGKPVRKLVGDLSELRHSGWPNLDGPDPGIATATGDARAAADARQWMERLNGGERMGER